MSSCDVVPGHDDSPVEAGRVQWLVDNEPGSEGSDPRGFNLPMTIVGQLGAIRQLVSGGVTFDEVFCFGIPLRTGVRHAGAKGPAFVAAGHRAVDCRHVIYQGGLRFSNHNTVYFHIVRGWHRCYDSPYRVNNGRGG